MAVASSGDFSQGRRWRAAAAILAAVLVWGLISSGIPPSPTPCGSPTGPPVTAQRVRVRDGRYVAYAEHGVERSAAKVKIVYSHGFSGSRRDFPRLSPEVVEEYGVYMVGFDRAGYGESDPDPSRTLRSAALDIADVADALHLGPKFYLMCSSLGCHAAWAAFHYIPHRIAGAALLAPVVNYRWRGLPREATARAYGRQPVGDQWALRVSYYAPWLLYWWMKQEWLPTSTVIKGSSPMPNALDERIRVETLANGVMAKKRQLASQQGVQESFYRDMSVMFGPWPEFEPTELPTMPFPVHLWQGDEDGLVPVELQRHIAGELPWISYHELPSTGHFLALVPGVGDQVLNALLAASDQ